MIGLLPARMRRVAELELDRGVTDAETLGESVTDAGKHFIVNLGVRFDQMRAKRGFSCAQWPDMQVVHRRDPGLRF